MTTRRTPRASGDDASVRPRSQAVAPAAAWTMSHIAEPRRRAAEGRRIVVALGAHGSGAPLLAEILHYVGVDIADDRGADDSWERAELAALQDEIFEAIERPVGSLSHSLPLPDFWWRRKAVRQTKRALADWLTRQLEGSASLWGFQDPRTCRLLPLWQEIFDDLGLSPTFVLALRDPASAALAASREAAASAPAVSISQFELMWLAYNYDVARYLTAHGMIVVNYDDWFDAGSALARRLAQQIEVPPAYARNELEGLVDDILAQASRRGRDVQRAEPPLPISDALFRTLLKFSQSGEADLAQFDRQAATIDLIFRCLRPTTEALASQLAEQREATAAGHRDEIAEREARLDSAHKAIHGLQDELAALHASMTKTLAERQAGLEDAAEELDRMREDRAVAAEARDRLAFENERLKREIDDTRATNAADRTRLSARIRDGEVALAAAIKTRDETRMKLMAAASARDEAQFKLAEAITDRSQMLASLAGKDQAVSQIGAEAAAGKTALSEVTARLEETEARLAWSLKLDLSLAAEAASAVEALDTLNRKYAELRETLRGEREVAAEKLASALRWRSVDSSPPVGTG